MFDKLVKKEALTRLITILLVASILLLSLNVLTGSKDHRRQIIDLDGGTEDKLCSMLSEIKGAGEVDVIIEYDKESMVTGVVITADGGANPVVANDLTKAVTTLYGIPVSNVIVFEKEQEE